MPVPRRLLVLFVVASLGGAAARPSLADSGCGGSGDVVVTDPSGDIASPQHDITAIVMAEVFGGTDAGKFRVTLQLAATSPPDSTVAGIWIVSWKEFGGDTTMTLTVTRCRGDFTGSFNWQSSDGQSSNTGPLDRLTVETGRIEMVVRRDQFGNPAPGDSLTDVAATTLVTQQLTPPLGCAPTLKTDVTGTGIYVMGDCVVAVGQPVAPIVARLGPPIPNPAATGVRMQLDLPAARGEAMVRAVMLDALGRVVRHLSTSTMASRAMLSWDLRDDSGRRVPPGTYWAHVAAGGVDASQSVVILR